MINKVISGCQTGADQAGLFAAEFCGLSTGGYIPKGHKTLAGPRPDLTQRFKLNEHSSSSYKERTWDNVQASDGTMRFAADYNSAGEKCTLNALINYNKPYLDFYIRSGKIHAVKASQGQTMLLWSNNEYALYMSDWLYANGIKVVNVAGNSEDTSPGIYYIVYKFLILGFEIQKKEEKNYGNKSKGL